MEQEEIKSSTPLVLDQSSVEKSPSSKPEKVEYAFSNSWEEFKAWIHAFGKRLWGWENMFYVVLALTAYTYWFISAYQRSIPVVQGKEIATAVWAPYGTPGSRPPKRYFGFIPGIPIAFLGRYEDNSDYQYRDFKDYFVLLYVPLAFFALTSRTIQMMYERKGKDSKTARLIFHILSGFIILGVIHGTLALFMLLYIGINFVITRTCVNLQIKGHFLFPLILFMYNVGVLLVSFWKRPDDFIVISPALASLNVWRGVLSVWTYYTRFPFLRCISFGMDFYYSKRKPPLSRHARKDPKLGDPYDNVLAAWRAEAPLSKDKYNLQWFFIYVTFPPLYLTGPIICFQDFIHQWDKEHRSPAASHWLNMILYFAKTMMIMFIFETLLSLCYDHSFFARMDKWREWPPLYVFFAGQWVLEFIWFKFMILWRLARFFSLVEGIDPPRNMLRMIDNNYSFRSFWQAWHASVHWWVLRYLYVPLGGKKHRLWNVWIIYAFIGLWHDITWNWITWAGFNATGMMVESMVVKYFQHPRYDAQRKTRKWKTKRVVGSMFSLFGLTLANLVIGLRWNGVWIFVSRLFFSSWQGLLLFFVVMPMMYLGMTGIGEVCREAEREIGVRLP